MHKCYVRHASADDVAVVLREAEARGLMVLAPLPDSPWVAVLATDNAPLDALGESLASRFGVALLVHADGGGWSLRVLGPTRVDVNAAAVTKEAARKAAQAVSRALDAPRITTALERVLRRPLNGATALDRLGEALGLAACGRTFDDIAGDANQAHLRVEGARIIGRVASNAAGAGYANVCDLVEDTVAALLERGRIEAALRQLRGYDVMVSVDDGAMRCQAPRGLVTAGLREALTRHKSAIVEHLSPPSPDDAGRQG